MHYLQTERRARLMNLLKYFSFKTRPANKKKERVLESIKKNLKDYNSHQISIVECLYKTGGLTADLIVYDNTDVYIPQKIYNAVSEMATNYYAMLYVVDIHTSYYELNKKNVYDEVLKLMTEIREEEDSRESRIIVDDSRERIYSARDFTRQLVDAYYKVGYGGCHTHLVSSVYSVLEFVNQKSDLNKNNIENIIKELPESTFFAQMNRTDVAQFLNYKTDRKMPVKINSSGVDMTGNSIHSWVIEITNNMNRPVRKDTGYRILSAVLHSLRDELDLQEVFRLSNHLPCSVRGLFFEGYDPEKVPVIMCNKMFMDRYHARMGPGNGRYLEDFLVSNHHHSIAMKEFVQSVTEKIGSDVDTDSQSAVEAVLNVLCDKTNVEDLNIDKLNNLMQETERVSVRQ